MENKTTSIWSAITGKELITLNSYSYGQVLEWSPDGTKIVTSSNDYGVAIIWSTIDGSKLYTLGGHTLQVLSAKWSPDGSKLAIECNNGSSMIMWNSDGTRMYKFDDSFDAIYGIPTWSPDGSKLATSCNDLETKAIIWSTTSGTKLKNLIGHSKYLYDIQWSPDGKKLASASKDGTTIIWSTNDFSKLLTLNDMPDVPTYLVRWSPDATKVAVTFDYTKVKIWYIGK